MTDMEKAGCDDWTKIAIHSRECGAQFFRKAKGQRYCDEHRSTDQSNECEHDWRFVRDWYGDPSIPYGTCDCSGWVCQLCGSTDCEDDPPDDGPDPDELRDRMIDRELEEKP